MADTQIIAASLSVNSDEAIKNVLKLKGTVEDLRKEFKKAEVGTDAQVAALKALKTAEEELAKAQKNLNQEQDKTGGTFSKIKDSLSQMPGAAGAAGQGVEGLSSKFKALLANPVVLIITAIIAVLALLYKAFTNTFAGAQKVEEIFAGLKAAAQALFDNIGHLASAFVKLMTFDFSGAVDEIKTVVKAAGDAYTAMSKLTKQAQDLHKEQLANDLDQAEREKKLAKLKEEAVDDSIPAAERLKKVKQLKDEAIKNAKEDLDLAKRTADNKIAILSQGLDGAKKNADEINKIKIEQIKGETENANELRRIGKLENSTEKEILADSKAAQQKATEEAKKLRQEYIEFTNKLTKLQQDNELALIKDSYQKELKALENKTADEKRANQQSFVEKKITRDQLNQLNAALDIQTNLQKDAIDDKHNKDIAAKESAFQKELTAITGKIKIDGIKDTRQSELVQLEIGYQEKLAQAIEKYKDDATKLAQIKAALDEQYRADKAVKEAKFKEEDDKKQLEKDLLKQEKIIADQNTDFDLKRAAVDQEQVLIQQAFDNKLLTEIEFNKRVEELAGKRKQIADLETAHKKKQVQEVTGILSALGDLVGKQTIAGKALGIATALINTYQGASEAIKQKSTLPSPWDVVAKVASVATIIATGLKTVKAITAVQVPGGGGGGQSVNAPAITTPSAPIAPTQTSTSLDQGTINNIGNAATGGVNGIRAYVVEQDSQAAVARAARLAGAAVLGG
jgi:hypothetical protein